VLAGVVDPVSVSARVAVATRQGREKNLEENAEAYDPKQMPSDSSAVLGHNAVSQKAGQPPSKLNSLAKSWPKICRKTCIDMAPHMARRRGSFYEELGAGDPVGAGADESAALGGIRTAALAICKRAPTDLRVTSASRAPRDLTPYAHFHHEWLIRI
jgi:hypothetical protein